jgi:hypothetical protein
MKLLYPALLGAALLAGCSQTTETEQTTVATPPTTAASPTADCAAAPPDAVATAPAPEAKMEATLEAAAPAQTLPLSFRFVPAKDEDNPRLIKTSVHIVLAGAKPQDIDMGRVTGKPDIVDEAKAKMAGFPADMLTGFRSYDANSGTGTDLAVMNMGGRLRILQRRIDEQATEPFPFQTAREIPLPPNTKVTVAPVARKEPEAKKKK